MNNSKLKVEVSNTDASPIYLLVFAILFLLGWLCLKKSLTNAGDQRTGWRWTESFIIHKWAYPEAPAGKSPKIGFEEFPIQDSITLW